MTSGQTNTGLSMESSATSAWSANDLPNMVYDFGNFFHPYVDVVASKLIQDGIEGVMTGSWQDAQTQNVLPNLYGQPDPGPPVSTVNLQPENLETKQTLPYANYNWEFFFHAPVAIAVHLTKIRRFAEAQRWFHFV